MTITKEQIQTLFNTAIAARNHGTELPGLIKSNEMIRLVEDFFILWEQARLLRESFPDIDAKFQKTRPDVQRYLMKILCGALSRGELVIEDSSSKIVVKQEELFPI